MAKKIFSAVLSLVLMVSLMFNSAVPVAYAASKSNKTIKITKQPVSVTVSKGSTAKVTLKASGYKLSYKWYVKEKGKSKYTLSKSHKKSTYSVKMSKKVKGRKVYCVVTNKYGKKVKSKTVTLNMGKTLKIKKQPVSVKMAAGGTVKLKVTASGEKLKYKWYYKNKNKSKFTRAKSSKKSTYSVKMSRNMDGRKVYCVVTDKYGSPVTSKTVTLSLGNSISISEQPTSVKVKNGAVAKVSVKATGDKLKYKWYYKDAGKSTYTLDSSFKSNYYSINMNNAVNGRTVYCLITDTYGLTKKTNVATLSMGKTLKITKQPTSVVAFNNATAKVNVAAEGDGVKYTWYYKDSNATKFVKDTSNSNYYSATMSSSVNGRQVYCVITDAYGSSVESKIVTLTMANSLEIVSGPVSQTVYNGSKTDISVVVNGDGLKYKWYVKKESDSDFVADENATGNSYNVVVDDTFNGAKVYCVVTDKYGMDITTETATITVAPVVEITTQPVSNAVYCGSKANIFVEASPSDDLKYVWYLKKADEAEFSKAEGFISNCYNEVVDFTFDNAQLYCEITDKYDRTITSNIATITVVPMLSITTRPEDDTVNCNEKFDVAVYASGDGLEYVWYCKKATDDDFKVVSGFNSNKFDADASEELNGAKLYCEITDILGNKIDTKNNIVTLTVKHSFDSGVETVLPTCKDEGTMLFSCGNCSHKYTEAIETVDHDMSDWATIVEPTPYEQGLERQECKFDCGHYVEQPINVVEIVYNITVYTNETDYSFVGVGENGKYTLSEPERFGYIFKGWTSNGEAFDASGKVFQNTTVRAVWEADNTDSLEKLVERANAGVEEIKITADIILDQPLYITDKTTVYSDADYSIIRANNYSGDMFVVGQDAEGNFTNVENPGATATLNLGGGEGLLTIDGNSGNTTVDVVGTLVFAADSCVINIEDGAALVNNTKIANKRTTDLDYGDYTPKNVLERIGGAAIINLNSTINMNGGLIKNNKVKTIHTEVEGEKKELDGCGGAIFNRGNFYMNGGTISNNEALRGGAIYNDRVVYINTGVISNNKAHSYGGAISSSSTLNADMFIGTEEGEETVLFNGNISFSHGGALYSNTSSPIIIHGNTEFVNNKSSNNGGAIYTAGTLTLSDTKFTGNSSFSNGGAVYHLYSEPEKTRRIFDADNCYFENNTSVHGGAITLSASSTNEVDGTEAYFDNCTFIKNHANTFGINDGNGGAIYVTKSSDVVINNCDFKENSATNNAGAISAYSEATVAVDNCNFEGNTALNGGGIYVRSNATVNITETDFTSNATISQIEKDGETLTGNGGAVYLYDANVTISNVGMYNNTSSKHAGAFYIGGKDVNIDSSCEFIGNTAAEHGGAIYVTYKTQDSQTIGSTIEVTDVTFENNSALFGGAISARAYSDITINGGQFIGNTTPNAKPDANNEDGGGGGAIYINNSNINVENVDFIDNTSNYYAGAIKAYKCDVNVSNTNFTGSSGYTGAIIHVKESNVTANTVALTQNTATSGYGLLYFNESVVSFENLTATDNQGKNGIIYASVGSSVELNNSVISNNNATFGGALYATGKSVINLNNTELTSNNATSQGGAAHLISATLNINKDSVISNNTANTGGAIYATTDALKADGSYVESVINVTEAQITDNQSNLNGGAVYVIRTDLNINDSSIIKNNVSGKNGGAIYLVHSTTDIVGENTQIINNQATEHGGAFYVVYEEYDEEGQAVKKGSNLNVTDALISQNTALYGGAISARTNSVVTLSDLELSNNSTPNANSDNKAGGGAIYANTCDVTLSNVELKENASGYYGGAIKAQDSAHVALNQGTVIDGNTAVIGAALHFSLSSSLDVDNITITNNNATASGVVYLYGNEFNFNQVNANNNTSRTNGGFMFINGDSTVVNIIDSAITDNESANGGALYAEKGTINLDKDTVIENNQASSSGGAIYSKNNATINVNGAKIKSNTASYGGAAYIINSTLTTTDGALFQGNASTKQGGAIYADENATLNVTSSEFVENSSDSLGGAAYVNNSVVNGFDNNTYTDNSSKTNGGALYINASDVLSFDSNTFTSNTADGSGGAVDIVDANITATGNNVFDNNSANNHGGAIYVTYSDENVGSVLNMTDGIFSNNTAKAGGSVSIRSHCQATFDSTKFNNNSVEGDDGNANGVGEGGGAIYIGYGVLNLNDVTASANASSTYGGVVDGVGATINVDGGSYSNNQALNGGVFYTTENTILNIENSEFINNKSTDETATYEYGGGAINMDGGELSVKASTFDGNETISYGGTILTNKTKVNIDGNSVITNSVGKTGAALSVVSSTLTIKDTDITNTKGSGNGSVYISGGNATLTNVNAFGNKAAYGGALFISGNANVTVQDSILDSNNVTGNGGALYAKGNINILGCTIKGNSADVKGGAIMGDEGSTITVSENTTFKNNTSTNGGAVYLDKGAEFTITDSEFDSNSSSENGGAITVADSKSTDEINTTFNAEGVTFKNNNANKGGAIATHTNCPNVVINVVDSVFNKNSSTSQGGAIFIQNSSQPNETDPLKVNIVFTDCEFTENSSTSSSGGAVEIRTSSCAKFDGITAKKNTAKTTGGVINLTSNYSRVYLTGTVDISSNTAKTGSFINLYNTDPSYSCPPKIYTTHSNTASWVNGVGGNSSNIAFNVVTLP